MSRRPLIIASMLGASVGVPYVVSNMPKDQQGAAAPFAWFSGGEAESAHPPSPFTTPEQLRLPLNAPGAQMFASTAPLEGTPRLGLEHVLRFDITKEWVYQHWARKSTGLADAEWFGVRVPLVTGTTPGDLAGSLTYYFDAQGAVQHIAFRGRTGDTVRLIDFLTRNYKFQPASAPAGEQVMQVASRGGVQSELRARPEAVLWNTSPHGCFTIELELARPGSSRILPPSGPKFQIPPVADAGSTIR